jgi:hypothetical protein
MKFQQTVISIPTRRIGFVAAVLVIALNVVAAPAAAATLVWTTSVHSDSLNGMEYDDELDRIVSGSNDNTVKTTDADGTVQSTFSGHTDNVQSVGIDSQSSTVVSAAYDDTLRGSDLSGNQKWSVTMTEIVVGAGAGSGLAAGGDFNGEIYIRDADTGDAVGSYTATTYPRDIAITSDKTIVAGLDDGNIVALDSSGTRQWTATISDSLSSVSVDESTGTVVAVSVQNDEVRAYDIADGTEKWSWQPGHNVRDIAVAESKGLVLSISYDDVYALDVNTGGPADTLYEGLPLTGDRMTAADDGTVFVAGSQGEVVRIDAVLNNPTPTAGDIGSPVNLTVQVPGTADSVEFYDGSDGSLIGTDSSPGSEASVRWDFDATARPQQWYAVAVDGSGTELERTGTQVFNSLYGPDPAAGAAVFNDPVTLSVDVAGVGSAYGGSATVSFYNSSGGQIGQDTLSADGTATATYNNPVAGSNEWYATVQGSNGLSDTLPNQTFQAPEQLEIRDEQNPGTLITNPGSAEVRFYTDSDQVYTRSPDNGTISLAGLPADETFVAAVSVEGYNTRTITIDSLLEQQTAYLLSENATVAEVDFELNDQTNQFPADQTTLFVQRAITRNNSTAWRTIVGERFGATGTVPTTLAAGDRYRLKVRNRDGDMRALGSYVAAGAAIEPLRIGQVTFQGAQDSGASFSSRFDSTSESEAVDLRYVDPSGDTDELNVTVRRQDANNTVVFEDSISGPIDTYRERIPTSALPGHTDDSSYKVEYSAARSGAAVPISGNRTIGDVPSVATDWPIDPQFLNIAGYLFILALFGAMVILSPRHAGLVGSATAFALSIMGVIAINSLVLSFALVVSGLFAVGGES